MATLPLPMRPRIFNGGKAAAAYLYSRLSFEKMRKIFVWSISISCVYAIVLAMFYGVKGYGWIGILDVGATASFAAMLSAFLVPLWSIVAAWVYYLTLKEQRKQIANMQVQHFDTEYFALLKRQWEIRDNIRIKLPKVCFGQSNVPQETNTEYVGQDVFRSFVCQLKYISEGIENEYFNQEWEASKAGFESAMVDNSNEVSQHEDPDKYEKKQEQNKQKLQAIYSTIFYVPQGYQRKGMPEEEAFDVLFECHKSALSNYFRHLGFIIQCLNKEAKRSVLVKDNGKFYLTAIKANLSSYEAYLLKFYNARCTSKGIFDQLLDTMKIK